MGQGKVRERRRGNAYGNFSQISRSPFPVAPTGLLNAECSARGATRNTSKLRYVREARRDGTPRAHTNEPRTMLRVHFLNVGHGDCTIIKHHSGRLTMIDVNNSQDFDPETFAEELEEERKKQRNALSGGFSGGGLGGLGGFGGSGGGLLGGLAGSGGFGISSEYAAVADRAKRELTDPIEFLKRTYPNETLWRFILTHPDLDHMRGLQALYENIGFANFWDTNHTKAKPDFRGDADKYDWNFYQWLRSANGPMKPRMYTRGHAYAAMPIMRSPRRRTGCSVGTTSKSCLPRPNSLASVIQQRSQTT